MGCAAGKAPRQSSHADRNSIFAKPKTSTISGSRLLTPSFSSPSYSAKSIQESGTYNHLLKKSGLQVDFISNPQQTDQITARITRNSQISSFYKNIQYDKNKNNKHVGTVQEKSEFEESDTSRVNFRMNVAFHNTQETSQKDSPSSS